MARVSCQTPRAILETAMSAASASLRLALAAAVLALSGAGAHGAQAPVVTDLDGRAVAPLAAGVPATVFVFTAVDCPISDRYAPEVRRLAGRFKAQGIATWIVYANAGERPAAARDHAAAFAYGLPVALDPEGRLAALAQTTVTPRRRCSTPPAGWSTTAGSTTATSTSASTGSPRPPTTSPTPSPR